MGWFTVRWARPDVGKEKLCPIPPTAPYTQGWFEVSDNILEIWVGPVFSLERAMGAKSGDYS
jgi:hypothetical protein